jgi:hypothetical protein
MIAASNANLLSDELEMESQKVRSMYEIGQSMDWANGRLSAPEITTSKLEDEPVPDEPEKLVIVNNTYVKY